jgi:hypothetical protein
LQAAGANLSQIKLLDAVTVRAVPGMEQTYLFDLSRHVPDLQAAIQQMNDCRLVIIDPIAAFLGDCDSYRDADVRALLRPLGRLAAECGVAVVAVAHLNKNMSGPAVYRSMGSLAFTAVARSVLAVVPDPDTLSHRLLLPVKSNVGGEQPGLGFHMQSPPSSVAGVSDPGHNMGRPTVVWHAEPFWESADALLSRSGRESSTKDGLRTAVDWLRDALADGPQPAAALKQAARNDGFAVRTLWRAKSALGVTSRRHDDEQGHRFVWSLP